MNLSTLTPGSVIVKPAFDGPSRYEVLANDGETLTVTNPDAGRIFGNRNRAPQTLKIKTNSKTWARRFADATVEAGA